MAYIFMLGVNCSGQDGAQEMVNYFGAAGGSLGFELKAGIEEQTGEQDGDWWVYAYPAHPETGRPLWGSGGPASAEDAVKMGDAGRKLYELLKAGPNFRTATAAIEATSGMSCAETVKALKSGDVKGWPGLVISRPLWREAGSPPGFVNFSDGYLWVPYEGEHFKA